MVSFRKHPKKVIGIFILCPFAIFLITKNDVDIQIKRKTVAEPPATKVILLWNSLWSSTKWGLDRNTSIFRISDGGNDKKCIFTNVHNFLPTVDKYDAIVFHAAATKWFNYPEVRDNSQKYIFATAESPVRIWQDLKIEKNFYNVTMTYRFDSDVLWYYGSIRDVKTNTLIAPAENPLWRRPGLKKFIPNSKLQQLISEKTNSIVWFVSRCETSSRREELVQQLKKHLHVDIFGKCFNGSLSCQDWTKSCFEMLDKRYKFYLSFENSLCVDYVSEKLFHALNRTIVPIVYGGANYSRFAPPHSYIDAQNFKNVAELAKYLIYLEKNTTAYGEYFWWKSYYNIIYSPHNLNFPAIIQDLCHYLHTAENRVQYYENIEKYFLRECNTKCYYAFRQMNCEKTAVSLLN